MTLQTWWQHHRKGESGSALVALGMDKMKGAVVAEYMWHFFNLAHCLVVNDGEQPPRTLQACMCHEEKGGGSKGNSKGKRRTREEEGSKAAA